MADEDSPRATKSGGRELALQSWKLILGLFGLFRFSGVREETIWLLKLDVYRGPETAELVQVTLGRDGILSLLLAIILLGSYGRDVLNYFRTRKATASGD